MTPHPGPPPRPHRLARLDRLRRAVGRRGHQPLGRLVSHLARASARHSVAGGAQPWPTLRLDRIREDVPGEQWRDLFGSTWPAYCSWYLSGDADERLSLHEARQALTTHMPEPGAHLGAPGGPHGWRPGRCPDADGWRMPPFILGTQAVAPGSEPVLVRNYDYDLSLFEGVVASTNWSGHRSVIGTSDLLWGLLDGLNEDGLAVSLTRGGRPGQGEGFGIPIVIRYLLRRAPTWPRPSPRCEGSPSHRPTTSAWWTPPGPGATVFVASAPRRR